MKKKGATPLGGGKYALSEGGDSAGTHFYDDPVLNALMKRPTLEEAEAYTGAKPSFYGVQRSGDWQRVIHQQMAEDKFGKERVARAQASFSEGAKRRNQIAPGAGLIGGNPEALSGGSFGRARAVKEAAENEKYYKKLAAQAAAAFTRDML